MGSLLSPQGHRELRDHRLYTASPDVEVSPELRPAHNECRQTALRSNTLRLAGALPGSKRRETCTPLQTGCTSVPTDLTASVFWTARNDVIIDSPPEEGWAVINDQDIETVKLWNATVVSVELISGERGEENERVLGTKYTDQDPFYMRTIRIVPNHQRVLRIDSVDRSYCGYVDHSLYELEDGRIQVVNNGYLEFNGVPAGEVDARVSAEAAQGSMDELNHGFGLLKQVVEERVAAAV